MTRVVRRSVRGSAPRRWNVCGPRCWAAPDAAPHAEIARKAMGGGELRYPWDAPKVPPRPSALPPGARCARIAARGGICPGVMRTCGAPARVARARRPRRGGRGQPREGRLGPRGLAAAGARLPLPLRRGMSVDQGALGALDGRARERERGQPTRCLRHHLRRVAAAPGFPYHLDISCLSPAKHLALSTG